MAPPVLLGLRLRCAYHRCRAGPFPAARASRRYCSAGCRVRAHRSRASAARLRRCSVEIIPRSEAVTLIRRYERLGSVGSCSTFVGLRDSAGSLLACVGFGNGPHSGGRGVDAVLERGFTRRRAPRNSGSYLIGAALRFCRRTYGWGSVRSYTDPGLNERGIVLKAAGFTPCPPSRHGSPYRYALAVGGRLFSDRQIYRRHGSHAAARRAGAQIIKFPARVAWLWRAPAVRVACRA
jgi:hypothetical protein